VRHGCYGPRVYLVVTSRACAHTETHPPGRAYSCTVGMMTGLGRAGISFFCNTVPSFLPCGSLPVPSTAPQRPCPKATPHRGLALRKWNLPPWAVLGITGLLETQDPDDALRGRAGGLIGSPQYGPRPQMAGLVMVLLSMATAVALVINGLYS